jgi:hypothetical protein
MCNLHENRKASLHRSGAMGRISQGPYPEWKAPQETVFSGRLAKMARLASAEFTIAESQFVQVGGWWATILAGGDARVGDVLTPRFFVPIPFRHHFYRDFECGRDSDLIARLHYDPDLATFSSRRRLRFHFALP